MIKFFYRLFNHHKLDKLNQEVEVYRTRVQQLEEEVRVYKGYKLKYKVARMLVDDDPAIDELLDCYKETEKQKRTTNIRYEDIVAANEFQHRLANLAANQALSGLAAQQQISMAQAQALGSAGYANGLGGGLFGIGRMF